MTERLFLYVDILGFSELIEDVTKVEQVYSIIDSLNVFEHSPYFKCIVFSDTILVYSTQDWADCRDRNVDIMWMCEFAQDLFYRLIGKDIHFRALLTAGDFEHRQHTNLSAFYGKALVRTYNHENNIICMGLFIDKTLVNCSHIFKTTPYDKNYNFVHIMQTLGDITFKESEYPFDSDIILSQGTENLHAYDFVYLRNIYNHMTDSNLDPRIRAKYLGTWQMLRARSAGLLDVLVRNNLDPRSISDLD
ncbi:MAG: hypothetical protein ACREDM_10400 [Methylocella sp.]